MNVRYLALAVVLCTSTACSRGSSPRDVNAGDPTYNRDQLSVQELSARPAATLYDAVLALRPNWLRPPGSSRSSAAPAVYVDTRRMGDVQVLRGISVNTVASVRYLTATQAQGRYGPRAVQPVIEVMTKSYVDP